MIVMNLTTQKKLAAKVLKCGVSRIWIDPVKIKEVSEAITTADVKRLIKKRIIKKKPEIGVSRKKRKKRKGPGSRKGTAKARSPPKRIWMNKIRTQRKYLRLLKEKNVVDSKLYRELYLKAKAGFFRSKSHIRDYLVRNKMIEEEKIKGVEDEIQKTA